MPEGLSRILSRASLESPSEGGPLERLRSEGWKLVSWRDFRRPWRRPAFAREAESRQLVREIESLAGVASECTIPNHPVQKHLECLADFVRRLRRSEAVGRADLDDLETQLIRLSGDIAGRHNKGDKEFSRRYSRNEVIELKDGLASSLSDFVQRADADLAALLQSEMQELIDLYEWRKSRLGKLDFFDLLTRTRDLIKQNAGVRRMLQAAFSHIFVDEFQDTDPVQAETLVLLSADDPDQTDWRRVHPVPGKLFVVGDPKQSIYRFRRADIILYQELCERLSAQGIATLQLSRSFRAVKPIQDAVNAAFAPEIQKNRDTGQPAYVPLGAFTPATDQPGVVALPVPHPYGPWGKITKKAIAESLQDTIAAFVEWLIRESGWKVRNPDGSDGLIPIASEHIAILFKRFMTFGRDLTRDYVHALEARNIPNQLWQARSFHQREEVETLRAALNAIEWPDDELSVFATLKGGLFAVPDSLLLRFRHDIGSFHPFRRLPDDLHADFQPIKEALNLLAGLHRRQLAFSG
jgi:ATP-dependent helicase/nuclease subunit A